jgi:hypothetical protein
LADDDEAGLLQPLDRLADRVPVHPDPLGEDALGGDRLAGCELAAEDATAQVVVDLVGAERAAGGVGAHDVRTNWSNQLPGRL